MIIIINLMTISILITTISMIRRRNVIIIIVILIIIITMMMMMMITEVKMIIRIQRIISSSSYNVKLLAIKSYNQNNDINCN